MEIIIIEGMDNTGKSTMIKKLVDDLKKNGIREDLIYTKHLSKPDGETDTEKAANIDIINFNLVEFLINAARKKSYEYIILDRSWYSEYVYGQIYRHRKEEDLRERIEILENRLLNNFPPSGVHISLLIFLASDPAFYIKHEDGESLSIGNEQRALLGKEMELFTNILYFSKIYNRHAILVNNGSEFLTETGIYRKLKSNI